MIFAGQENTFIIFRSKEIYIFQQNPVLYGEKYELLAIGS